MNLSIAYTLTPRFDPTINKSIESLRNAWFTEKVYIYAEPWEYSIKDKNTELIIHEDKKGCFLNFDYLLRQHKDDEYLFYMQDDYLIRKGAKEQMEAIIKNWWDFWYYNFILDWRIGNYVRYNGWNNVINAGWNMIWAGFLLKNIKRILEHPFYNKHLSNYVPKRNQQIDACIWQIWKELWLPCYIPSHSYIAHIGASTIGHSDPRLWIFFKKNEQN